MKPPQGEMSWLFGTMHIRDDRVHRFCESLYSHICQADIYIGEMDLAAGLPDIRQGPSYSMQSFFRPSVYLKLRKQLLKSFSLDIGRYDHLHPLLLMSAITQQLLNQDHTVSMDEHLWDFAKANHLDVRGLESVEEQLSLLHGIAPGPLYRQIKSISRHPDKFRSFTKRALEQYTENRLHRLYQMTKSSMHHLRKKLIYARNKTMADRILAFPTGSSYFIAVGAGHLSGPSGLISLLRKAGWKVKPLPV